MPNRKADWVSAFFDPRGKGSRHHSMNIGSTPTLFAPPTVPPPGRGLHADRSIPWNELNTLDDEDDATTTVYGTKPLARKLEWEPTLPAEVQSIGPMEKPGVSGDSLRDRRHGMGRSLACRPEGPQIVRSLLVIMGVAMVLAACVLLTRPRTGRVTVFVTGVGNAVLDRFNVAVDGRPRCTSSPCIFHLEPGTHGLRAESTNHIAQEHEVAIGPGSDLALRIALNGSSTELDTALSDWHAASALPSFNANALPAGVLAITPGSGALYTAQVPGPRPSKSELQGKGRGAAAVVPSSRTARLRPSVRPSEPTAGTCSLNINSIPPMSLMLDGEPYGSTPRIGVSATSGTHTVVFVQPDGRRKSKTVSCKPGESKVVAVRLSSGA